MIEWLATAELQRHLDGYAPIGLWLREWFHARTDVDPRSTVGVPAEPHVDEGIGELDVWCGLVDGMPFAIRSTRNLLGGFGFEIRFPVRRDGNGSYRDALAELGARLPAWRSPYVSQLPTVGWFVVGPDTGPYVARLESTATEEEARRLAARWAAETGVRFDVRTQL